MLSPDFTFTKYAPGTSSDLSIVWVGPDYWLGIPRDGNPIVHHFHVSERRKDTPDHHFHVREHRKDTRYRHGDTQECLFHGPECQIHARERCVHGRERDCDALDGDSVVQERDDHALYQRAGGVIRFSPRLLLSIF